MGSVSDRSNPRYFLPPGLLLSCGVIAASGLFKSMSVSLGIVVALQAINGWVQGMDEGGVLPVDDRVQRADAAPQGGKRRATRSVDD